MTHHGAVSEITRPVDRVVVIGAGIAGMVASRLRRAGLACDAGDPVPSLSAYDQAERRRLDRPEVETYAQVESEAFWDAVDAIVISFAAPTLGLSA